ncbi:MAG: exosortase/archaeosortase family protein [Asgard group archaeon]|nr:exosortase/archaeosortase family protein [Asgard group archaeon]
MVDGEEKETTQKSLTSTNDEITQDEKSQNFFNRLNLRYSNFKQRTSNKLDPIAEKFSPLTSFLKKRYLRYAISSILVAFVIYFYVMYEISRGAETVKILFRDTNTNHLVPLGLVLAFIAVLYVTWDDNIFKKYRKPGLYVVLLTTIFYVLIFSGIDTYLFELSIAKWLTRLTGLIVPYTLRFFGLNVTSIEWNEARINTFIGLGEPSKTPGLLIDPRCSGIHSMTIFIFIFLLMLFEARKKIHWNHKAVGVTIIGILGTYLMNFLRITIVMLTFYYGGTNLGESVHNVLGYVLLVIWLPIFWLFILPLAEKGRIFRKKKAKEMEASRDDITKIGESEEKAQSENSEKDHLSN